jgi:hypothetical protein
MLLPRASLIRALKGALDKVSGHLEHPPVRGKSVYDEGEHIVDRLSDTARVFGREHFDTSGDVRLETKNSARDINKELSRQIEPAGYLRSLDKSGFADEEDEILRELEWRADNSDSYGTADDMSPAYMHLMKMLGLEHAGQQQLPFAEFPLMDARADAKYKKGQDAIRDVYRITTQLGRHQPLSVNLRGREE